MIYLRIGFFTDTYSQINGVTITIKALEKSLRHLGHEVFIFAPRGEIGEAKDKPYLFTSESIRFILSPEYKWAIFPVFTIPQSNLGLDVIHVHSPVSMGLAGLVNAKRLGIPCIGSVHTLLPEFWKPFLEKYLSYIRPPLFDKVIKRFIKLVDRFSLINTTIDLGTFLMEELTWRYYAEFFKRCDISLVPSVYAQNECQKHGFESKVLPNGIDFSKFHQVKDLQGFNQRWKLDPKDRVAIYVGRLSEEKNINLILQSAHDVLKTVDHLKYMIVGDGPWRSKLERRIENYGISDNVIFTGYLEQEALSECYSRATFFINASPLETQGLSVIEAMYFGCPILSIDSGAVAELFHDRPIGSVFKDSKDLSEKIYQLLTNQKSYQLLRENARIKAREYDMNQFSSQLIAIYQDFITKK